MALRAEPSVGPSDQSAVQLQSVSGRGGARYHHALSNRDSESSLREMRLAIAFLFVVTWTVAHGYDYASACARPYRSKRAKEPDVPCDLSTQSYCTSPGDNYPWHAIRRFIRENQGLMRRMYGEERHIAVLKAELENFIDDDDDEHDRKNDLVEDFIKTKMMFMKKSYGRGMKDKPHFRPIQQNPEKQKKVDSEHLKVKPLRNTTNTSKRTENKTEIKNETVNEDKGISYKTKLESIANIEINNLDPDVITLEAVIKQSIETNSIYPNFSGTSKSEPLTENKNKTDRNATSTTENVVNTTENVLNVTENIEEYDDLTTESGKDAWKSNVDTSTLPPTLLFSEHDKVKIDRIDNKETEKKEEFHPKPAQQETMRPAVIKLRGANACETKEEMMAPFWANSTRGEMLALLNMYPFEQYIHSETCVHKHKQMYCREGCRCEQQFRLHRLLAYDPRNECRGIFADWFKFPACCVCKCYDVPLEFRARSPRILHPQYDEEVKRLIYEDVARDWYTMSYDEEDDELF
ncbi:protein spaetzle 4 [Bicyclus anynana]|uniref:Protein spaetzle 4 n=1 Tax=Bicyclus anynana TaxID=110368 RepID=A0A6J1NK88_BICAN|nr:protein spaetzle 4 [Bicyclus anynana]